MRVMFSTAMVLRKNGLPVPAGLGDDVLQDPLTEGRWAMDQIFEKRATELKTWQEREDRAFAAYQRAYAAQSVPGRLLLPADQKRSAYPAYVQAGGGKTPVPMGGKLRVTAPPSPNDHPDSWRPENCCELDANERRESDTTKGGEKLGTYCGMHSGSAPAAPAFPTQRPSYNTGGSGLNNKEFAFGQSISANIGTGSKPASVNEFGGGVPPDVALYNSTGAWENDPLKAAGAYDKNQFLNGGQYSQGWTGYTGKNDYNAWNSFGLPKR